MPHIKARMGHGTPGWRRTRECPKRGDWWGNRIQEIGKLRGDFSSMALLRSCPNKDSIALVIQLNSTSLSPNSFLLSLTSTTVSEHAHPFIVSWYDLLSFLFSSLSVPRPISITFRLHLPSSACLPLPLLQLQGVLVQLCYICARTSLGLTSDLLRPDSHTKGYHLYTSYNLSDPFFIINNG